MGVSFGFNLPAHRSDVTVQSIKSLALQAESLGFDLLVMADHVVLPTHVTSPYPYAADRVSVFQPDLPFYEPLSTLLFLAGCTDRIRLGINVLIVPYRPAVLTAKMLSMLDVLSGGRLTVGVGVGWMEEEFLALGMNTFSSRGAVTDEYIEVFKALWTQDEPHFEGRFCQVSNVKMLPRPVQTPHPPIWVGGHTDVALRRAARYGDAWLPLGTFPPALFALDALRSKIGRLRQLSVAAGRAEDAVGLCFGGVVVFDDTNPKDRLPLRGSAEQIINDLHGYHELGVDQFILYFLPPGPGLPVEAVGDTMERFARQVMPALR